MDQFFFRQYGVATTVYFVLRTSSATNALPPEPVAALAFAAGDITISKDGAAFANCANVPTSIGNGYYSLVLTAAEMQGSQVGVLVKDQSAPTLWLAHFVNIETFLKLRSILVTNDGGDAISATSTFATGNGLVLVGNTTGDGLRATGGATGNGLRAIGGATSGAGLYASAPTSGNGITATGGLEWLRYVLQWRYKRFRSSGRRWSHHRSRN